MREGNDGATSQSFPSISSPWAPIYTEYPLPLWLTGLIHPWSGEVPCRGWGESVTGRAQGSVHSIDAFENCCPLRVQIQEIVVETPALAAERER